MLHTQSDKPPPDQPRSGSDDEFHSADEGEAPSARKKKISLARQESKADMQRADVELQFELKKVRTFTHKREKIIHTELMLQTPLFNNSDKCHWVGCQVLLS